MTVSQFGSTISQLVGMFWNFLTNVDFPLFQGVSFGGLFLFIFLVNISFKLISRITQLQGHGGSLFKSSSLRKNDSNKHKG